MVQILVDVRYILYYNDIVKNKKFAMPHLFFFSNLIYRNLNNPSGGSVNSRENNEFDTINQFGSWMVDQLKTNFPGRLPPNGVYPFKVTLGNTSMDLWIPDGKDAEFTIRITYLSNKQRE